MLTPPGQEPLYGLGCCLKSCGDFVIIQIFIVAEHYGHALLWCKVVQSDTDSGGCFAIR